MMRKFSFILLLAVLVVIIISDIETKCIIISPFFTKVRFSFS